MLASYAINAEPPLTAINGAGVLTSDGVSVMAAKSLFDLPERLQDKIMTLPESGCWLWIASLHPEGYPMVNSGTHAIPARAHRLIYALFKGDIPDGLHLDHLCRVRPCVNPDHLEPVTCKENLRRGLVNQHKNKTHCKNGHLLDGDNLSIVSVRGIKTRRRCKTCKAVSAKLARQRRNA